jgi:hypothetical protein
MSSFIQHLTDQLQQWPDETTAIRPADVQQMLLHASDAALNDIIEIEADRVRVWREIDPVHLTPAIIIEVGGDGLLLLPPELKWLKALLLSYDEDAPPQVGEPLSVATRLNDGRVVSTVIPELLASER